ncbi:hypothetical protein D3C81_2278170 [compost metagenome]
MRSFSKGLASTRFSTMIPRPSAPHSQNPDRPYVYPSFTVPTVLAPPSTVAAMVPMYRPGPRLRPATR